MSFFLSWIKNYVKNPLELGAILPTYKFAANLMTKNIISNEKTIVVMEEFLKYVNILIHSAFKD